MRFRVENRVRPPEYVARKEKKFGINLPGDFRDFLVSHNGGQPHEDNNTFKYKSFFRKAFNNELTITNFYSVDEIEATIEKMSGVLPSGYIPIARLNNGSPLLLCGKLGKYLGYIYILESDYIEDGAEPVTVISSSFTELTANLKGVEENLDDIDPCNLRYYKYQER